MSATDLLTGDFTLTTASSATDVYNTIVTDQNLATGEIANIIEKRVNDVFFSGKTKANNSYNSVLTYTAAEAVLGVLKQTAIKIDSIGNTTTPDKIDAHFNDLNAAGNLVVTGNLTVNGTTTTVNSNNTVISDNLLELNSGLTGTNANDCGIIIERGSSDNAIIYWDETNDEFSLGTTTATANSTGTLTVTKGKLHIGTLKMNGTDVTASAAELNILDGDTSASSVTVEAADRVIINDGGNMIQVAMSAIKDFTNTGVATFQTPDRDGAIESAADPTNLNAAISDIYYKLHKMDAFLKHINDNIEFTNGYTSLDFDNTA